MTEEEKFMFDLEGYLVIKGVLTPDEVAELNAISDTKFPYSDPDYVPGRALSPNPPKDVLGDSP